MFVADNQFALSNVLLRYRQYLLKIINSLGIKCVKRREAKDKLRMHVAIGWYVASSGIVWLILVLIGWQ